MRYKTLFRLGVKWIGLCAFLGSLVLVVERFVFLDSSGFSHVLYIRFGVPERLAAPLMLLLIGWYLFFRGNWIVNLAIPSNRPYCPECGFDHSKQRIAICPECGTRLPSEIVSQLDESASSADDGGEVSARTHTEET